MSIVIMVFMVGSFMCLFLKWMFGLKKDSVIRFVVSIRVYIGMERGMFVIGVIMMVVEVMIVYVDMK